MTGSGRAFATPIHNNLSPSVMNLIFAVISEVANALPFVRDVEQFLNKA
jgi:hypothetical protein